MEHEEEFEARQSISSRGRDTRTQMMPGQNRDTNVQNERPTESQFNQNLHNYQEGSPGQEEHFGEGESSSVITEIVDERVEEIDTENEEEIKQIEPEDDGVNQYLDNIKQEDYVNHDEYNEYDQNDASPYRQDDNEAMYENEPLNYEGDQNYNAKMYGQNMENSPIQENPDEEEMTGSPQYYEAPRAINPKYRRKYEGVNIHDKSHLIWEQERLQRRRLEREMQRAHLWTKQFDSRDIDWHPTMNPKRAAFNTEKNPKRSNLWHFSNTSSVPLLTTAKNLKQNAFEKVNKTKHDPTETQAKRDHRLNNVFHQSSYQNLLSGGKGRVHAPSSHTSMKKEVGRAFMTPIDNRYQNQSQVQAGRARMFHSSQVF